MALTTRRVTNYESMYILYSLGGGPQDFMFSLSESSLIPYNALQHTLTI